MEPQLIRKRKGRKGWGTVLCLGLPYRASPWNLPTSTQSLDLSASGVFGFQLHPLSFTNILRARTLKKNQLFNFESQALYRERPISASIGKKMELGNGLAGCYHLRSGRSAVCEVWVFPFIFKVGVYRIRGPPWEISFPPRGWGDNRMATPPRPASRESV